MEWEEFGRTEPHWSVLTHDKFRPSAIAANLREFFESGRFAADIVRSFASRHELVLRDMRTCFELGCGVGRITVHLAEMFQQVIGADISKFHLTECAAELAERDIDNVRLMCLDTPASLAELPEIDFFFSFIVLQHNPPPVITYMLDSVLRKVSRGGAAVFQVPTWRNGYGFDLADYLAVPRSLQMEMHVIPQEQVFRVAERNGCRVVEVREDGWAAGRTAETLSNTFFMVKQ